MSDRDLTLTVLGAGTSAGCGYPLAKEFFPALREFGNSLGSGCEKLRTAIEYVIAEAASVGAQTIDDLTLQALRTRFGGMPNYNRALRRIAFARIVTDAFFLDLETKIQDTCLQPMRDLVTEMFGPYSDNSIHEVPQTNHRLATFNYDRIAEIVFSKFFAPTSRTAVYAPSMLNAGVDHPGGAIFEPGRFSFLKLHGTIGVEPYGANEDPRIFGKCFGQYAPFRADRLASLICDSNYFEDQLDPEGLPKSKRVPLIVFPAEKQRIEAGGEEYNLKEYVKAIRATADETFKHAATIRVIGYSFAVPDKEWLISLLLGNPDAKKIIINPHADQICENLEDDGVSNLVPRNRRWGDF
jgi:hypothetical protein